VELTPDDEKDELINNAKEVMDPVFQMNAGKDRVVFNENHPYFSVAKGDKGFAKENFGLPIPETDYFMPPGESQNGFLRSSISRGSRTRN
jgi:hypothetical protein